MWVTPGRGGLAGILDAVVDMEKTFQPIILAAMSGGALGAEGVLASKIINAGAAIQKGNTLGGLSQLAGIAQMTDTATALRIGQAIQNNDLTSLATGALRNTSLGQGIGSTEILPDLTVTGALNLASAVTGLTSKNPRTVINSIVDLQDRVPDLFDSLTSSSVTGGGGLDTLSSEGADTLSGGAGGDTVTNATGLDSVNVNGNDTESGWDAWTNPLATNLGQVTVTGSNGNDVIDNVLNNLNTNRSLTNATALNNVEVTGSCPAGQVRNPITKICEDVSNILSGVTVTGTTDTTNTTDTVTGGSGLDTVTVTGTCLPTEHKDPITGACVPNTGALDTVTVADSCTTFGPTWYKDPVTGNCVDSAAVVDDSCPPGKVKDPVTGECVNKKEEKVCQAGYHPHPVTGECVQDSCPSGQTRDPVTGECKPIIIDTSCPVGQSRNAAGECVLDECPAGQERDPNTLQCVTITAHCSDLGPDYYKDPVTGKCVRDECPAGQERDPVTGLCEIKKTKDCPAGYHPHPVTGECVQDSCPSGQTRDPVTGECKDIVIDTSCPKGQHRDSVTGECVLDACPEGQERDPNTLECVTVTGHCSDLGPTWYKDPVTGKCVDGAVIDTVTECQPGYHPHPVSGECVQDKCPAGQTRDPVTGECKPIVIDTSCPTGQHRDTTTGECIPNTTTTTTTTPVLPVTPTPVTPTPTGGLPTYTDPTGIAGKIFTLGQLGGKDMPYNENLKQLTLPTMQHWSDMPDAAMPTVDVNKAMSALAQYAPDAEKDVIPSFYAHGGAVQHFADGAQPDAAALIDAYNRRDLMDAFKNLGNIGSGLEPLKPKVFQMGQMGAAPQQKSLQQMTVIPQLAALLQSRGMKLAEGGRADHEHPEYDGTPVFRTGGLEGLGGKYVEGKGDGTSDDITAMLANGEYVFSADVVSALGNGSNKAGAKELDHMVQAIRSRARSAPPDKLPPDAKSPLEYLKSSKGSKHG